MVDQINPVSASQAQSLTRLDTRVVPVEAGLKKDGATSNSTHSGGQGGQKPYVPAPPSGEAVSRALAMFTAMAAERSALSPSAAPAAKDDLTVIRSAQARAGYGQLADGNVVISGSSDARA